MDQIHHNTVTGTDNLGNGTSAVGNQVLRIAQPHVSTVGKPRNLQQVGEVFGLGVHDHLHHKAGSKFRQRKGAHRTTDILLADPQCGRRLKQTYNVGIAHGHGGHGNAGVVF